jgi:hypothetical protein
MLEILNLRLIGLLNAGIQMIMYKWGFGKVSMTKHEIEKLIQDEYTIFEELDYEKPNVDTTRYKVLFKANQNSWSLANKEFLSVVSDYMLYTNYTYAKHLISLLSGLNTYPIRVNGVHHHVKYRVKKSLDVASQFLFISKGYWTKYNDDTEYYSELFAPLVSIIFC